MKYTIDRFEGKYAVVELKSEEFINVPRKAIPPEAKEGDIIVVAVDNAETKERKEKIEKMMKNIWAD